MSRYTAIEKDRRFRIWVRPSVLIGIGAVVLAAVLASWIEVAMAGLPAVPPVPQIYPNNFVGPHGFPLWVRYCHFFNFFFVMLLIRSGLSILFDHPRLYFNDDCTPGSEWIRLTPLKVPHDRIWTAKDDARYLSPIVGTPGYRHTIGIARVWHFIDVHGFIFTGIFLYHHAVRYRAVAADRPYVVDGSFAGLEYVGALRDVPHACRDKRLLWLQRPVVDGIAPELCPVALK